MIRFLVCGLRSVFFKAEVSARADEVKNLCTQPHDSLISRKPQPRTYKLKKVGFFFCWFENVRMTDRIKNRCPFLHVNRAWRNLIRISLLTLSSEHFLLSHASIEGREIVNLDFS